MHLSHCPDILYCREGVDIMVEGDVRGQKRDVSADTLINLWIHEKLQEQES